MSKQIIFKPVNCVVVLIYIIWCYSANCSTSHTQNLKFVQSTIRMIKLILQTNVIIIFMLFTSLQGKGIRVCLQERCIAVNDRHNQDKSPGQVQVYFWFCGGCVQHYHPAVQEEGLLTIDENQDGRAVAFGDNIAVKCLAADFQREVFVVKSILLMCRSIV